MAVAFGVWKHPAGTPIIQFWNRLGLWPVSRVADLSDLVALVMLPMAGWATTRRTPTLRKSWRPPAMALVAAALVGTSKKSAIVVFAAPQPTFVIDAPVDQVRARMARMGAGFYIPGDGCGVSADASIAAIDSVSSRLTVHSMRVEDPCDRTMTRGSLLALFRAKVVGR